jgi:hypothetical protein
MRTLKLKVYAILFVSRTDQLVIGQIMIGSPMNMHE